MTVSEPDEDCPVCNSSQSAKAKETFATAKVAEHIKEKARHNDDDKHQEWVDEHTENGTLSEIRNSLRK
ncbi:MAG: hypothetical protein SXQ77_05305 [Halobacteria archaeon]|nr:hypothetical protein [Halobacteria archaeon]